MKAAIYNPYLDTLGGGERYSMAIANVLAKSGYKVFVQWQDVTIKGKLEERFGIKLNDIEFVEDIKRGDGYDVCFWVSDGSIPFLSARKNFLHFQVPFQEVSGNTLINKIKFFRIKKVICNSLFTKKIVDNEYAVDSIVLYPPVDIKKFKTSKKEKIILFVGRFSNLLQAKGQDILIDVFKRFSDLNGSGWKLILAGGVEVGAEELIYKLLKQSENYNVEIVKKPTFIELKKLYAKAKFFWSAAGFDIDESKDPKKVEHFGITVVEAMAAGCVPIIFNAGGHKEIISNAIDGFLWNTKSELINITEKLTKDNIYSKTIAKEAQERSKNFSYENFENKFILLL